MKPVKSDIISPVADLETTIETSFISPQGQRFEPRRSYAVYALIALFALLTVWTVLIIAAPGVKGYISWRQGQVLLETGAAILAVLTAIVAYTWLSLTRSSSTFWIGLGVSALAYGSLFFAILTGNESAGISGQQNIYLWTSTAVVSAIILAYAIRQHPSAGPPERMHVRFVQASAVVILLITGFFLAIWQMGDRLPALSDAGPSLFSGEPGAKGALTGAGIVVSAAVALALFVLALAVSPSRPRQALSEGGGSWWLSAALITAAFTHIHFLIFPVVLPNAVSSADILRVATVAIVFYGLLSDVRATYRTQEDRAEELDALAAARSELGRLLTHDVLLSLGVLRTFAVSLTSQWSSLDEKRHREIAERIERETSYLRDLMDRTIAVVGLGGREDIAQLISTPILPLVRDVAEATERAHLKAPADGIDSLMVELDPIGVRAVLSNLISNAQKYSAPDRPIEVGITAEAGEVVIRVTDQGAGIPEQDLGRIFERSVRSTSNSGSVGGWGMGLYIARSIVEAHGGRIWAASEPGVGSCFSFALPLHQTDGVREHAQTG